LFNEVRHEHNAEVGGRKGMAIHVNVKVNHAPGLPCEVVAVFLDGRGELLKGRSPAHRTPDGYLVATTRVTPRYPFTDFKDLVLFIPYDEFTLPAGEHELAYRVSVVCPRDKAVAGLSDAATRFTVTSR